MTRSKTRPGAFCPRGCREKFVDVRADWGRAATMVTLLKNAISQAAVVS